MSSSEILLYQTEDGQTKIDVRLEEETVWLTQTQMSELFQKERSVITKHINNVFEEGELQEESNVQILHISGSDRPVKFYNLNVIISVGYRVKSHQGTKFRQWATARLKEYIKPHRDCLFGIGRNPGTQPRTYVHERLERIRIEITLCYSGS